MCVELNLFILVVYGVILEARAREQEVLTFTGLNHVITAVIVVVMTLS